MNNILLHFRMAGKENVIILSVLNYPYAVVVSIKECFINFPTSGFNTNMWTSIVEDKLPLTKINQLWKTNMHLNRYKIVGNIYNNNSEIYYRQLYIYITLYAMFHNSLIYIYCVYVIYPVYENIYNHYFIWACVPMLHTHNVMSSGLLFTS